MDRKGFLRRAAADRTVSIDTTVEVSHRLKLFPCEQMQRRRCRLKIFVAAIRDLNEAATKTGCQRLRLVGVRMVGGYLLWAHRPTSVACRFIGSKQASQQLLGTGERRCSEQWMTLVEQRTDARGPGSSMPVSGYQPSFPSK